jgi:hypothetical protein
MNSIARSLLLSVFTIATPMIALDYPALAADCGANVSQCISQNQGKPDALAKCAAAGQKCAKTGVFVGPFNGQTYQVQRCSQDTRKACY